MHHAQSALGSAVGTQRVPDPSYRGLYRAGAAAALLYAVMIALPVALLFLAPQPPLSGGADLLRYVAAHRAVYLTLLVSFVGLSLPALVVFLALYAALRRVDKGYAALGAALGAASETVALAYGSSPPSLHTGLLWLSERYAAASSAAERTSLEAAAEALMAASNAVNAAGILTALGILIVSLPMRGGVFPKGVAYLGVVTGVAGVVCEVLRDTLGAGYFVYGTLLPAWFVAVGWTLYRLARGANDDPTANPTRVRGRHGYP